MKASFFGLASTGFSGVTNIIVQLIAAILLTTEDFALFSLGATTIILFIGLSRIMVGQVDVIRGTRQSDTRPTSAAYFVCLVVALTGALLMTLALILGGQILWVISLSIFISSIFILQDNLRFRSFREGSPGVALVSDLVMFAVSLLGLAFLFLFDLNQVYMVLALWAVSATAGAAVGIRILRYYTNTFLGGIVWFKANKDIIVPSAGEYALISGLPYMVNFLVLFVGGPEALAGYRLIQLILAGVGNIAVGLNATAVPRLVNADTTSAARRMRSWTGIALSIIIAIITFLIIVIPEVLGLSVFGDNWTYMQPFIWVGAFHAWFNALGVTNMAILLVLRLAVTSFWIRLATVLIGLVLTLLAAHQVGDPVLIAWGIAFPTIVAHCVRVALVSLELRKLDKANSGRLSHVDEG